MTDSTTTRQSAWRSKQRMLLLLALVCIGCRGTARPDIEPTLFQSLPIPSMRPDPSTVRMCGFEGGEKLLPQSPSSLSPSSPSPNLPLSSSPATSLAELTASTLTAHPSIIGARQKVAAAQNRVPQATAFDDPVAGKTF